MLLLDTCTLLWLTSEQSKISTASRQTLVGAAGQLYVSAINEFEIAQKTAKGKLLLPRPPLSWMELALRLHGLKALALNMDSAISAGALPALHGDPFDRLLISTPQAPQLTLLTPDRASRTNSSPAGLCDRSTPPALGGNKSRRVCAPSRDRKKMDYQRTDSSRLAANTSKD